MKKEQKTEVCILGGGVAGLSAAYFLSQAGFAVCVIENGVIAGGQTSSSTSHLTFILDTRYTEFEKKYGRQVARAILASHRKAIDAIEEIIKREHIRCGFERVKGYRFAQGAKEIRELQTDLACLKRLGFRGARLLAKAPIHSFESGPALCVPHQAQCELATYVRGLAKAVRKRAGES